MITDGKVRLRFRYKPDLGPLEDIFRFTPYLTPHEKTVLEFLTIVILKSGAGRIAHYLTNDKIRNGYGDTPGTGLSIDCIVKSVSKLIHLGIIELWVDRSERNHPKNYYVLMYDEPHQDDSRWWEEFTRVTVVEKDGKLIRVMEENDDESRAQHGRGRLTPDVSRGLAESPRGLAESHNSITHYIRNTQGMSSIRKTHTTHTGRLDAAPVKSEKPEGLKPKFTAKDLALGRRLYSLLRSHGKRPGNQKQHTLAEPFRLMREVDKIPVEEIEETLTWYEQNFSNKFTPRCYTSEQFRQKYQNIRDAMERPVVVDLSSVKPSSKVSWILQEVENDPWPPCLVDLLPGFVEHTYRTFQDFLSRGRKQPKFRESAEHIDALSLTQTWIGIVQTKLKWFKNFSGDFSKFMWDPKHPDAHLLFNDSGLFNERIALVFSRTMKGLA